MIDEKKKNKTKHRMFSTARWWLEFPFLEALMDVLANLTL
jgi:hypothetical protein